MNKAAVKTLITADTTVDPLISHLKNPAVTPVLNAECAPFDNIVQVLNDRNADFLRKEHEILVVWSTPERIIPSFADVYTENHWDLDRILNEVDQVAELLVNTADKVKLQVVMSWVMPPYFRWIQSLTMKHRRGPANILMHMNLRLAEKLRNLRNTVILDMNFVCHSSAGPVFDPRMYALGKIRFSRDIFIRVSEEIKALWNGCTGLGRKLIITDLDNTLWGGIIGDDGRENIKLGGIDPVGESFVMVQKALKQLKNRGILLAICSKNEESVAMEMIEEHPEMVLRKEDFATWRINWNDKAENVAAIVDELNMGLQSAVFLDDTKAERERVKSAFPDILVPDLPQFPVEYPGFLFSLDCFEANTITSEDLKRTEYYQQEFQRKQSKSNMVSLNEWLNALEIRVTEMGVNEANLTRVCQLFNKTNQFNARTRRMSRDELQVWLQGEGRGRVMKAYAVRDRYGDQGITGIASAVITGDKAEIVDFILSCRVFGKQIEDLMLSRMITILGNAGIETVRAPFSETRKNKPVQSYLTKKYLAGSDCEIDKSLLGMPSFIKFVAS